MFKCWELTESHSLPTSEYMHLINSIPRLIWFSATLQKGGNCLPCSKVGTIYWTSQCLRYWSAFYCVSQSNIFFQLKKLLEKGIWRIFWTKKSFKVTREGQVEKNLVVWTVYTIWFYVFRFGYPRVACIVGFQIFCCSSSEKSLLCIARNFSYA